MSASACIAYFGLRFMVMPHEIDQLEARTDPRQVAAKKIGLTSYWGNFGGESERHILFVGTRIAILGPENEVTAALPVDRLLTVMSDTATRLQSADLVGEFGLHLEWLADV